MYAPYPLLSNNPRSHATVFEPSFTPVHNENPSVPTDPAWIDASALGELTGTIVFPADTAG